MALKSKKRTPREIRRVFADNLTKLVSERGSIADISRDLKLNRVQLARYMKGDASPRATALYDICEYFGVDARILLVPIEELRPETSQAKSVGLSPFIVQRMEPASQTLCPDGLYFEWRIDPNNGALFRKHLMRVYTDKNIRWVKMKLAGGSYTDKRSWRGPPRVFCGQLVAQGAGFVMIDTSGQSPLFAMTSFRFGFRQDALVFPGYKLVSSSYVPSRYHLRTPCVLERLDCGIVDVVKQYRTHSDMTYDQLPERIRLIFDAIHKETHETEGLAFSPA